MIALDQDLAQQLLEQTIAVQLNTRSFGNTKKLNREAHNVAAQALRAQPKRLKTSEVLIDPSMEEFAAVTSLIARVRDWFDKQTIPYPQPAIRLMHRDKLPQFQRDIESFLRQLRDLVYNLDNVRYQIIDSARIELRDAFQEELYPLSFAESYAIEINYPAVGPDPRLQALNPQVYAEQQRRFISQIDAVIQETTDEMSQQFSHILNQVTESLREGRRLKSNAFDPLCNFLERFENIKIGTSTTLQEMVSQARQIINQHSTHSSLNHSAVARSNVASALAPLAEQINSITTTTATVRTIKL